MVSKNDPKSSSNETIGSFFGSFCLINFREIICIPVISELFFPDL